jgi:D-sedoheptulose 7-phosphate isomerase
MADLADKRFDESIRILAEARRSLAPKVSEAAALLVEAYRGGHGVFAFGNGGSAADAQHIVGELVGRFLKERRALKAEALSTNTSILTALGNDYSFDIVFARQLEANAKAGDVAIGLSTSGNSRNVVAALAKAREMDLRTIAFTGQGGGQCKALADVLVEAPSKETPRIQECHVLAYHVMCELVEAALADEDSDPRR